MKCVSTPKIPLSLSFVTIPAPRINKSNKGKSICTKAMQYQNYVHATLCASFSLFDWQQLASFVRRPCHAGDTFTVIRRKGGKGGENWPLSQTFLHDSFPFLPRPHPNTVVETSFKVNVGNMPPPSLPPACCPVLFWREGREKG